MDIRQQRQVAFSNKFLELILFITEQCNFRCKYCYEDFAIGRMKPDVISGVKNLVTARSKDLEILKISWFGGEPLIVKHLIYELSEHIQQAALLNNIKYFGTMTTNGYLLTPSVMATLCGYGVTSFQISLDGVKADHDKTRLRIDNQGTFDQIWKNLLDLSKTKLDFEIILRIHVHIDNYNNIKELLDDIVLNFGGDHRYKVFIKGIFGWQGAGDQVKRLVAKKDFYKKIEALKQELSPVISLYRDNNPKTMCYAAMGNTLAIRANGQLAKCTVALDDDRNNIGRINPDGSLEIDNNKANKWVTGLIIGDKAGIACPWHKLGSY